MTDAAPRTLADDFTLVLDKKTANRGLARRLMDQTLRPGEREDLRKVQIIADLEEQGHKYPYIARELGWDVDKLRGWVQTDKYRVLRKYCAERVLLIDDTQALQRRQGERKRFDANAVKALDYLDRAFARWTKDIKGIKHGVEQIVHRRGDFCDLDRAERATQLIAKAQGWTEPLPSSTKPRQLAPGVIQAQMQGMAAADRRETVVRITVGETTVEVGNRSETATMGGEA